VSRCQDGLPNVCSQSEKQRSISSAELELGKAQTLPGELRTLRTDMEEKQARLEKLKSDSKGGNYEERLAERSLMARKMEDRRDELSAEFRMLSVQADARIKLDVKAAELKTKIAEVKNMCVFVVPRIPTLDDQHIFATSQSRIE
jgi:DNA repair protein RAD50